MHSSLVAAALLLSTAQAALSGRDSCNNDNCLRAFIRSAAYAVPYCFTAAFEPTPTVAPWAASACTSGPAQLKSACTCWAAIPTGVATSSASPSTTTSATSVPKCSANSNYAGFSSLKYAFIFGDSYSTTGFNFTLTQPSPTNPLGNPTYPGYTASDGPNWVDYLTTTYNQSLLQTYNLAYGGATVDSALVAPYEPQVSSVAEQVENEFFPAYGSAKSPTWVAADTLFGVFIGINDVGNSYGQGAAATTVLNREIFAVYAGLVDMLYNIGGRNFLFLNVPPVDRSPLTTGQGASSQAEEKADIAAWNSAVASMASQLKSAHADTNVFTVDTNSLFTKVLDNPASFPQTSGYRNTTNYCVAYENGTPTETTFDASCGIPVNEYFWLNSLHPTYPMQDVLGQTVANVLAAGPNVC